MAIFGQVDQAEAVLNNVPEELTEAAEVEAARAQIALAKSWQAETQKIGPKVSITIPLPMPTATRARFFPGEDREALTPINEAAQAVLKTL